MILSTAAAPARAAAVAKIIIDNPFFPPESGVGA